MSLCRQSEPLPSNQNDSREMIISSHQVRDEADTSSTARSPVLSRHLRPSHSVGKKHFRGVRHRHWGKFTAEIIYSAAKILLGSFETAEEAAAAYDRAALRMHGPNAILNFPEEIDAAADQRLDRNAKDLDSSKNYLSNSSRPVSSEITAVDSSPK